MTSDHKGKQNCRYVGVQGDSTASIVILGKQSDILILLLVCVESDKIPLLCKLNAYLWGFQST